MDSVRTPENLSFQERLAAKLFETFYNAQTMGHIPSFITLPKVVQQGWQSVAERAIDLVTEEMKLELDRQACGGNKI